jgi:hypothetical protein
MSRSFFGAMVVACGLAALGVTADAGADAPLQPTAGELAAGARFLDARAEGAIGRAERLRASIDEMREQVRELRSGAARAKEPERGRLSARADDLELRIEVAGGEASRAEADAAFARARAKELRERAKARASQPEPNVPHGTLTVASERACDVEIDGVPRGMAPITRLSLRTGTHRLECRSSTGERVERFVEVRAGQTTNVVLGRPSAAIDPF